MAVITDKDKSKAKPIPVDESTWKTFVGFASSKGMVEEAQPQVDRVMEKTETLQKTGKETSAAWEQMKQNKKK